MKYALSFVLLFFVLSLLPGRALAATSVPTPTATRTPTFTPTPTPSPVPNQVVKSYCASAFGYESLAALKTDVLANAKRMAVNELFGELITASTSVENFTVTSDQIRALSAGFVRVRQDRYAHGPNLGEVCVTITAYATDEDRAKFDPVRLNKRNCVANPNMTTGQIRAYAQEEVLVQALIEYDRRLAETDRGALLRLMRRVSYTSAGFVSETETYCVTAQGDVTPVEVITLLEGTEVTVAAEAPTTSIRTATPRPRTTQSATQPTATPRASATPVPAKSQAARIIVRGADSSWMAPMAESSLSGAIPNEPVLRIFAAYTEALQQILFGNLPPELIEVAGTVDLRVRSAYTGSHLSIRFIPLPDELLTVLAEIKP